MAILYRNSLTGTFTGGGGTGTGASITDASLTTLPVVSSPDILRLSLDVNAAAGTPEIVYVTNHTASSSTITCSRAQEAAVGGAAAARSHAAGVQWAHVATAVDFSGSLNTYTPQIDQGATTNITKTVNIAEWFQVGLLIVVRLDMVVSGTGTAGSSIIVSLPTIPVTASFCSIGGGLIYRNATGDRYQGQWEHTGGKIAMGITQTSAGTVGQVPSFALANNDAIRATVQYRWV